MSDDLVARLAGDQFNRLSRAQLHALGLSAGAVKHRVARGRLAIVEHGAFAVAPVLAHDPWGRWMAVTLTEPGTALSHLSAAVAEGVLSREGPLITVTRPGNGGPRRYGGILVHHSSVLDGEITRLRGIPITTPARTLVDIAGTISDRALARAVRESVRLGLVTLPELGSALGRHRGRRGIRSLAAAVARYSGLPLERARSGAEVLALEHLRAGGVPMPGLNVSIAGEEADLSWPAWRLIIEIDGGPFHLDAGEDARKEHVWRGAGWAVRRLPAEDVYERPGALLSLAHPPELRRGST